MQMLKFVFIAALMSVFVGCSSERAPDKTWIGALDGDSVQVQLWLGGSGNASWPDILRVNIGEQKTNHPGKWSKNGYLGSYSGNPPDSLNSYSILEISSDGRVELSNPKDLGLGKRIPLTEKGPENR